MCRKYDKGGYQCRQKDKHTVVVEESAFEASKKRFHFAATTTETTVPLLKAQL